MLEFSIRISDIYPDFIEDIFEANIQDIFDEFPYLDKSYIRDILEPIYRPPLFESPDFLQTLQAEYDFSILLGIQHLTEYLQTSPIHMYYAKEFQDMETDIAVLMEKLTSYDVKIQDVLETQNREE